MVDLDIKVPRDREAEQAVLGAALQNAGALRDASALLDTADFYDPGHELIWGALRDLAEAGSKPDVNLVMQELTRRGTLSRLGGAAYLFELIQLPVTSTNVTFYARKVREASRARHLLRVHQGLGQALSQLTDHDDLLAQCARFAVELEMVVDERGADAPIEGLYTWDEFIDKPRPADSWLIPGVLMKQDVMMVLGGEGGGKSWLTRQICMAIAAGINPFRPDRFVTPRKTLLCDLENAEGMVAKEARTMQAAVTHAGHWGAETAHIWHYPAGMNLRKRSDALMLERVIAETGAEVVGLGSLYNAHSRGRDDWETAAEEVKEVFNRLRARYNVAFVLEHHQPKASGGSRDRPDSPFGSSVWMKWPSVGRIIRPVGDNMYAFEHFRGDRGVRDLPVALCRGGELPWTSVWDRDEMEFGMWDELKPKR